MTTPSPATCPACAAPLTPGARYCHRCGRSAGGTGRGWTPWAVAWTLIGVCLLLIIYTVTHAKPETEAPVMANVGSASGEPAAAPAGRPPDISQLTPRERFLRLHDRVMAAAGQGDSVTAARFAPMALSAYGMLDTVDTDARFQMGELLIETGATRDAAALADTILAGAPNHLLGLLLRAEVARASKDRPGEDRARKGFLGAYDAELRIGRPEYRVHLDLLEQKRDEFRQSK
jgi:hypothetical protein